MRRIFSFFMVLLLLAAFYVFAVMMENEDSKRENRFLQQAETEKLEVVPVFESSEAEVLARAFKAAFPLPEGLEKGSVSTGSYHGYTTRIITLNGSKARVMGVRPASAAPSILPRKAAFQNTGQAMLGFPLMSARMAAGTLYSLMTPHAAFLIEPIQPQETGSFTLYEP